MCELLGVKRANYYKWLRTDRSSEEAFYDELITLVLKYHEQYSGTLGYRQMRDRIWKDEGKTYSDGCVYKVMKFLGIASRVRKQSRGCTKVHKSASRADNILSRKFEASRPNEKWVTDVTEFKYYEGAKAKKLYLSAIIDLYDRSTVGYVIGDSNNNELVFETFRKAIDANPDARPLFHSDAGFQYTSPTFITMLKEQGMTQSMSRVGCCLDNAVCEGFWSFLKTEAYHGIRFTSRDELYSTISGWLRYYNYERTQRRFGVRTPIEVREAALAAEKPVQYSIPVNKRIERYKQEHYSRA